MVPTDLRRTSIGVRRDARSTVRLRRKAVRPTAFGLMLLLSTNACYQYFPVSDVEPLPKSRAEVRISLSEPTSLDVGSETLHQVSKVEGDVYRSTGDTLAVFSRWLYTSFGYRQPMDGAVFFFDRNDFGELEERRLVAVKTAVAVVGVGVGLFAFSAWAIGLGGGSESGNPDGSGGGGLQIAVPIEIGIPIPR